MKNTLVSLLDECVKHPPDNQVWKDLCACIEDYQRLGTSDVFNAEQQADITSLALAASTFHRLAFNSTFPLCIGN